MAYSTANWHWKNKTVTPWAKEWFERELVTIQVEGSNGAVVSVEHVISVDGDVEVGRRKSKYVRAFSATSPPTLRSSREDAFFTFVKAWTAPTTWLTCTTCRLITIYDCKVVLEWKSTTPDGTEVKGKLTIPEVSHEITLDGLSDYVVCAPFCICREAWLH
jgi:activator of HSP90 ATPase